MAELSVTKTVPVEPTLHMKLQVQVQSGSSNSSSFKFRNVRLDPARALEPARKKLTTVEAQRVMAVFEETIRRVQIVTLLPYIMQNMDRFSVSLGSELVELLKHHSVIISSYDEIRQELDVQLERRAATRKGTEMTAQEEAEVDEEDAPGEEPGEDVEGMGSVREGSALSERSVAESTDSQLEATIRNLSLVAQQMSHSTRNILRAFTINPAIMTVVTDQTNNDRDPKCRSLIQYLQELREILLRKLLTTPEEEREGMAYLGEICRRERQNTVIIDKLEQELKVKNEDKEQEIQKKNEVIKRLQSELHQIEKLSEEHIRRVRADAEKQEAADEKSCEGRRQKLQMDLAQFRSQLQNATLEHREREQELRSKKFKIETEVESWIMKYDQALGERQDEFEEIDEIYTEEKKQLHELEERFNTLEKEYLSIMVDHRNTRERREKAEREVATMVKATTTIQAFWRSYKVRRALKQRKKKKAPMSPKAKGKGKAKAKGKGKK